MTERRRAPRNVRVLQRWVGELAREQGVAPGRVQRWITFMVVAGLADNVRDENGDPLFLLKGGAALELRLGLRARATKDFDASYRAAFDGMLTGWTMLSAAATVTSPRHAPSRSRSERRARGA